MNLLKKAQVFAVTELPPSVPTSIGLRPFRNANEALAEAIREKGRDSEVLVVLNAAITVPVPSDSSLMN